MLNKLFITTLIIVFISCLLTTGCISKGGKKLGGGSVGRVIKPLSPSEFNQSATFNPIVSRPKPLEQVKIEAIKSKPVPPKPIPAEMTPAEPKKIPPAEWKNNFEPTVTPAIKLPEVKVIPKLPANEKVNVKPVDNSERATGINDNGETNIDNETNVGIIDEEKENKMETNWTDLIIFYGILAALVLLIWLFLDKRDTGKGLINKIKNWWNGNKAKPKGAASKKRTPAKRAKRPVKKKPLATRGERKSNLAAKKNVSKKRVSKKKK